MLKFWLWRTLSATACASSYKFTVRLRMHQQENSVIQLKNLLRANTSYTIKCYQNEGKIWGVDKGG